MSEIIPVAFSARWRTPVCFVQKRKVKRISGPADAIRHMRDCFIDKSGPAYSRAVDICFAALRCETDPDIARVFFLAAFEDQLAKAPRHR
ncbi:DUF982 domain-containing protein [Xaviernesmea oryzae]|mgnify:CR=1 FL=1|uniref:DUF982 domain-containing protein n=1 Tax=Xaviernesmea oryzae TaxID=464029 RepID=UPI000A1961BE